MARPLTKRNRAGQLYFRPGPIETNIDGALGQDLPTLRRRLQVIDRHSPDYLPSESLIHLFREATARADTHLRDLVLPTILARCEASLLSAIPDRRVTNAGVLREEVLQEFALMLANDRVGDHPNELDYFECRFNRAFRTLRIDVLRREQKDDGILVPLPSESPESDAEGVPAELAKAFSCRACQEDDLRVAEMLDRLPPHIRKAVVFVCILDYEVESTDSSKITAATLCGKAGRTIRNWLQEAKQILSPYNQETI
jgi:hypothetical protein